MNECWINVCRTWDGESYLGSRYHTPSEARLFACLMGTDEAGASIAKIVYRLHVKRKEPAA